MAERVAWRDKQAATGASTPPAGLKRKELIGIPWRLAFALQSDGWYLRSAIVWHKSNTRPDSAQDRPARSYEFIFLLTKRPRYYYNRHAIKEPATDKGRPNGRHGRRETEPAEQRPPGSRPQKLARIDYSKIGRNKRDVWLMPSGRGGGGHYATFPEELVETCVLAGSRVGDVVLDPFGGSGTTERVACRLGRRGVMLELNPKYLALARELVGADVPTNKKQVVAC